MDVRFGVTPPPAPPPANPKGRSTSPANAPPATAPPTPPPGAAPPAVAAPSPPNGPQFGFSPALDLAAPPPPTGSVAAVDALIQQAGSAASTSASGRKGASRPSVGISVQERQVSAGGKPVDLKLSFDPPPPGQGVAVKVPTPPDAPAITLHAKNSGHATESLALDVGNTQLKLTGGSGTTPSVTVGDLNGDGAPDVIVKSKSNITNNRETQNVSITQPGVDVTYKEVTVGGQTSISGKIAIDEPGVHLTGRFSVDSSGAIQLASNFRESPTLKSGSGGRQGASTNPLYNGKISVNLPPPPPPADGTV